MTQHFDKCCNYAIFDPVMMTQYDAILDLVMTQP